MAFKIEKARKEQIPIKTLFSGSSGSGKTYSALRVATGIAKKSGGKILMVNTEGPRGKLYGDEFDYSLIDLDEPRSTDKYIEVIKFAEKEMPEGSILIIDSLSHEWTHLNETVQNMPGNSFQNWGKLKPKHQKLIDLIVESPLHILATGRGKDEYVMEENDKGKKTPKKVGVGIQQEKDTEYEFITTFNIAQDTHVAVVMKDNTHLFEGQYTILTEEDGIRLYEWSNSGTESPKPYQEQIIGLAKELGGSADDEVRDTLEKILKVKNPRDCKDADSLKEAINALEKLKEKRGK